MHVFSAREKEAIRNYKYSGGDASLIYKYILSPFAQFCVDYFTPTWVAPNVITLLGLLCTTAAAVLTLIFNPSLDASCPKWLSLFTGVSILAYQTLDNMDGKQARRTGSSSSLGMLFDHACDAINAVVSAIPVASTMGLGWTDKIILCFFCGFIPFYLQTWEECYVGSMNLPIFNGSSEGLLMVVTICMISTCYGSTIWAERADPSSGIDFSKPMANLSPYEIAVALGGGISVVTAIDQTIRVLILERKKGHSMVKPLLDLSPFIVYFLAITVILYRVDTFKRYPQMTFVAIGCTFIEMAVHLLVSHITKSPIKPFERVMAWATVLLPVHHYFGLQPYFHDFYLVLVLTTTSFSICFVTLFSAFSQFMNALNIHMFVLGQRKRTN